MKYFIYETTNSLNGKKYRGYHATENIEDGYIGSGTVLWKAILKHGKEKFTRIILEFCESAEEMVEREKFYVDEDWVNNRDTYNMQVGGRFKPLTVEQRNQGKITKKERFDAGELPSTKNRIPWNKGKKMSKEFCDSIKNSMQGKDPWNKGITGTTPWNKGISTGPLSESHKANIASSSKGRLPWNTGKDCTGIWKGKASSNRGKSKTLYLCPHCKREISGSLNFNKWHNDNCKHKL